MRTHLVGKRLLTFLVAVTAVLALAAGTGLAKSPTPRTILATRFAKIAPLSPPGAFGHVTVVESPVFGPDGQLYFVNLSASEDQAKVRKLDVKTKKLTDIYFDNHSEFSSLQFSPVDGRMYLTDYGAGKLVSMTSDGKDFRTEFEGKIEGHVRTLDDIAFDTDGSMFVSDEFGTLWAPEGVVIKFDKHGHNPKVLMRGLAGANGISFTPDYSGLWVSEYRRGQISHFWLNEDHTAITDGVIGIRANTGKAGFDSNAVDTAGNIYQAVWEGARILVFNKTGDQLATIKIPQNLPKPQTLSTNIAIKPGTRQGYIIVGGENGGYLYRFRALAEGGPQSNGG